MVCCDSFPPFPSHYVPCRQHLTAMFVKDYWETTPTSGGSCGPSSAVIALPLITNGRCSSAPLVETWWAAEGRRSPYVRTLASYVACTSYQTQPSPGSRRPWISHRQASVIGSGGAPVLVHLLFPFVNQNHQDIIECLQLPDIPLWIDNDFGGSLNSDLLLLLLLLSCRKHKEWVRIEYPGECTRKSLIKAMDCGCCGGKEGLTEP